MARIANGDWLMQQIDGMVVLFHEGTEQEIIRFDPSDGDAVARAQHSIHAARVQGLLSDEERCFAHFWSGYFYAHATSGLKN